MSRNKTLVFLATYNENLNIVEIFSSIIEISTKYDVLIIDDNSTDGTKETLEKLSSSNQCLTVINRPSKMGIGSAHRAAMIYAFKNSYEQLVTMDADFSHSPVVIPKIIEKLKDSDFVIGSRYMKGGKSDYEGYRKWVSIFANKIARLALGIKINECTTSYRAFRTSLFDNLNLSEIRSNGYSFFLECVYEIKSTEARISEIPIHFKDRIHGNSKIPKTEIFRSMYKLICLFLSRFYKRQTRLSNPIEIKQLCHVCKSQCIVEVNNSKKNKVCADTLSDKDINLENQTRRRIYNCLVCDFSFFQDSIDTKRVE